MAKLLLRDLTPGTLYKIQLRAVEGDSVSDWSRLFELPVSADVTPPDVPLWAVSDEWVVNGDTFVATWQPLDFNLEQNQDFDHYELELGDGFVSKVIRTNNISYTLTFENNRITFGSPRATVTARVRSVDGVGNASAWTTLETATNPAPDPVSSITTTSLYDAVDVKWEPGAIPDDFKAFVLQVSTTSASTGFTTIYEGPNSQFQHASTQFLTDHWYRVYVRDKFGTLSTAVTSASIRPKSTFSSDLTPPNAPATVTVTPGFNATTQRAYLDVTWTASTSTDTAEYEIGFGSNLTNFSFMKVGADFTTARIDDVKAGQGYYVSVRAIDGVQNKSTWRNASVYPVAATGDTTAPSQPAAPTSAVGAQKLQVVVSGLKQAGGAMEPDVAYYEVFASVVNNFTTYDSTTMIGTIQKGPAMVETFQIPASAATGTTQTWRVKIRAVDFSGNVSPASLQATAIVGLIATANIGDAQITNAKISSLDVDKLTAGTGIATDFTIKSTLTLGELGNDGVIQSYDYGTSGGSQGFSLDSDGLVIKTGTIEAAALKIQDGANEVNPFYSSFEAIPYTQGIRIFRNNIIANVQEEVGAPAKFGTYSLGTVWGARTDDAFVYLGSSATDYNQEFEVGTEYIVSAYARVKGAVPTTVRMKITWDDGTTTTTVFTANPITGSANWQRFSGVITATTRKGIVWFDSPTWTASAGFGIDGIQIEKKRGQETAPSTWKAPGVTTINGGLIRTGAIESTAPALDAMGNAIPGVSAWKIDPQGTAVLGDVLIRGRLIMGVAGTEAPIDPETPDTEDLTGVSYMQSYNYVPGAAGWIIKSNGNAEFLQLAANSISSRSILAVSPDKLDPGRVEADLIVGSSLSAIDQELLFVTHKQRTGNYATLTLASSHQRAVGDSVVVELDQSLITDMSFNTPEGASIVAVTDNTISYLNPGSDVANTAHDGTAALTGRAVQMTGTNGITLLNNDGVSAVVKIPTNPLESAFFSGNIQADSLTVVNDFLLQGVGNYVSAGSMLTLNASVIAPASTPASNTTWPSVDTWLDSETAQWRAGLYHDAASNNYFTMNTFLGGAYIQGFTHQGYFVSNDALPNSQECFGLTMVGTKSYTLELRDVTSTNDHKQIRVVEYSGVGPNTGSWVYNERTDVRFNVTADEWDYHDFKDSGLPDPCIGTDGTNIYIARPNKNGNIIVSWYTTSGTRLNIVQTNVVDKQNLKSINVGAFDFGANRWVITTGGNNTKPARNYVTSTGGTHQTSETWLSPANVRLVGTAWNGSEFVSLSTNHRLYTHSAVAKNGSNVWYAKSTWYDGNDSRTLTVTSANGNGVTTTVGTASAHNWVAGDKVYVNGTGTVLDNKYYDVVSTPTSTTLTFASSYSGSIGGVGGLITNEWETTMSDYSKITVTRRGWLTLSATAVPVGAGDNIPDRARFYFSTSAVGPFYRQDNPLASNKQTFTSNPIFSGSTSTLTPFPAGTPAKIVSNNGLMEISSDGFIRTDRLVLESQRDVNANAGNEPALMIGDSVGNHMRMDGNEIQSMNSTSTTGTLFFNSSGGQVSIGHANSQTNIIGELWNPGYATGSGTANALIGTSGRLHRLGSSRRYKQDIEDFEPIDPLVFLQLRPRTWRDRGEVAENPDVTTRYPGYIAEEVHDLGLGQFVIYDDQGRPDALAYDKFSIGLLYVTQMLKTENAELNDRVNTLEDMVAQLRGDIL